MHRPICADLDEVERVGEARVYWFVRNPWEWYVSQYRYWSRHYRERTGGYAQPRAAWTYNERYWAGLVDEAPTFRGALPRMLGERSLSFAIDSQCAVVPGMRIGTALRFERLRDEAERMLSESCESVPDGLRRAIREAEPRNASKHRHYASYYDAASVELVRSRDGALVAEFGYEFEARC